MGIAGLMETASSRGCGCRRAGVHSYFVGAPTTSAADYPEICKPVCWLPARAAEWHVYAESIGAIALRGATLILLTILLNNVASFATIRLTLARFAERSRLGRQVLVTNSGHGIPVEAPDAVIRAVREVVAMVRASASQN